MENLLKNCGTTVGLAVLLVSAGKTQKKKGGSQRKRNEKQAIQPKIPHIFFFRLHVIIGF